MSKSPPELVCPDCLPGAEQEFLEEEEEGVVKPWQWV